MEQVIRNLPLYPTELRGPGAFGVAAHIAQAAGLCEPLGALRSQAFGLYQLGALEHCE